MAKKKFNLLVFFLIFCFLCFGLGSHSIWTVRGKVTEKAFKLEWDYTFGGPASDSLWSAIQTTDGGFVLAGSTQSFGAGNSEQSDAWLIKTDANGLHEWNRTFGDSSSWNAVANPVQTADGGYFLAYFYSPVHTQESNNRFLKLDNSGNDEWNASMENFDYPQTVIQTSDGGFLFTTFIEHEDDSLDQMKLFKLDASGIYQWNSTLTVGIPLFFSEMIHTLDGGFLLVGGINQNFVNNFFLLELRDETGTAEWNTSFGGLEHDRASDVIQLANGSILVTGPTTSYAFSSGDFWLVKTDSTGQPLWNTTFGGHFEQSPGSLIQTADGGILLAGTTSDYLDNVDIWLVKTDANGGHVWNMTFGGSGDDSPDSVYQAADGNFVVAGYTESFGAGEGDMFLFKVSVSDKTTNGTSGFDFSLVVLCFALPLLFTRNRKP